MYQIYEKNYKTLIKAIKETLTKWRDIPYSWIGKLKFIKCYLFPTQSIDSVQSQ